MPQLKALGGLRLEPSLFTQPKPLLLLTFLSLEGQQARRHLAELFWQHGNRMKSLSMTFTRLRQGAGEIIVADTKTAWTTLASDVKELLAALDQSDWQKASELYTGAFVEGVVFDDWSSELEEWVYTTREYLAERVQFALLNLAEDAAKHGDFAAATRYGERAYTLPGLAGHEVTTLKRLYTLLCAGRSLLAPEVRKEAEGYGVLLELTTETAQAAFESGHSSRALPMRGTSFIGRDLELTELASLLARPNCQLVTILGSAGLGKTRLALQFAHDQQLLSAYADGVYFVGLESLSNSSDFPTFLAQQLGLKQGETVDALEHIVHSLQNKQLLLVLDNFEHLTDAAPQLSVLLRRCPQLRVLVTSRERLHLEEEYLFTLAGLRFPQVSSTPVDTSAFDALQLFEQRAKQLHSDFDLTNDVIHVIKICQLVEGSPLGIELAAGWVRLMACSDIADEIQKNLDFLASTTRNTPDRHRSIRATFDYSWALLSEQEQDVFAKLAVFRGGFRREAASEVAGATIPLLALLVDKSLLRVLPNGRYDQHPLIYQYAQEKLQARADRKQIEKKHLSYYLNLVAAQEEAVQQGKQENALRVFREEWQNAQVIPESILESGDEDLLLRWVELVDSYYDVRGSYTEALAFLTKAADVITNAKGVTDNAPLLGRVLLEKGYALLWLGEAHKARETVLQGLTLIPETLATLETPQTLETQKTHHLYKRWRVRGLNSLGFASTSLGDYARAFTEFQEALDLARVTHYTIYEAHLTGNLGINQTELGNFVAAEAYHQESLRLYKELGAINGYAREHLYLALTYYMMDELAKAKLAAEEGLRLARAIDYTLFIPYALGTLSLIASGLGDLEAALEYSREALRLNRETDDKDTRAKLLRGLALAEIALGHIDAAILYGEEALALARETASDSSLAGALLVRGELLMNDRQYERAAKVLSSVVSHPALLSYERKLAKECLLELEAHLSPRDLTTARSYAESATLEGVVRLAVEQERDVLKSR